MKRLNKEISQEFIKNAIYRMDENTRMVDLSLEQLSEELLWKKPNSSSNSIGNLILHLCGNITQYAIASLEGVEDIRERQKEFSSNMGFTKAELWSQLSQTVERAKLNFKKASIQNLMKIREVQGFKLSGIGIILHVVEHYSYHTGQIAFWTKAMKNKDLGFYDGVDLTLKNKE